VPNAEAVRLGVVGALALGCEIHHTSIFARKNYFYPDLPKGYQISQFDKPLATHGSILGVRILRIHMEEDAGKLMHESDASLVDLNRAGVPLIEIVSEPDITSSEQASTYLTRLRQILMYAEVCDGNMEEGSMRCDANVSVRRPGEPLGTRTEIKNLNSFRYLRSAIDYEVQRQIGVLEGGGKIDQETRLFDPHTGETRVMRSKEEAHDYRYFPDPDLFTLAVDRAWIEDVRSALPALPDARIERYQREHGMSIVDAEVLVAARDVADYYEATAEAAGNARAAGNWVRNEVLRVLNEQKIDVDAYRVTPPMLGRLIRMIDSGAIGGKVAKEVFEEMSTSGEEAEAIVARKGLAQVSDPSVIREAALRVIEKNAASVEQFRAGSEKVFGFLVGQLMKETRGKAKADLANEILRELLEKKA
jgi:aspartyl-tRNA(Asn)/glutamyl-tRNA(Gln) amidotransferase subunit B